MNTVKGWKTILFNGILVLTGSAEMAGFTLPDTAASDINGAILAVVGVVGMILRVITTGPVGEK